MRILTKCIALFFVMVVVFGVLSVTAAHTFGDIYDVTPNQQHAINRLQQFDIVHGVDATRTRFAPHDPICRAAFVKIIYTANNGGIHDFAERYRDRYPNPFADVDPENWSYGYLIWALENNIVSGEGRTPDGRVIFNPRGQIRLVEATKISLGLLGYCAQQLGFNGPDWRQRIMQAGADAGLLLSDFSHIGDMEFLNRAEAALFAYNAFQTRTVQTINSVVVPDNTTFIQTNLIRHNALLAGTSIIQERNGSVHFAMMLSTDNVLRNLPIAMINGIPPSDARFAAQFAQLTPQSIMSYRRANSQWTLITFNPELARLDVRHTNAQIAFDTNVNSRITVAGNEYVVTSQTRFFVWSQGAWQTFTNAPAFNINSNGMVYAESRSTHRYARIVILP